MAPFRRRGEVTEPATRSAPAPAPIPAGEAMRLQALRRYEVLDTAPEAAFDRIADLAARLFGVPIGVVSLVDRDRVWFKSHRGLALQEVERAAGLCASAILAEGPTLIPDTSVDSVARSHPLVAGEAGLRFYAGAPLRTAGGHHLGTLCVMDRHPRQPGADRLAMLEDLAAVVMDELDLRLAQRRALQHESVLASLEAQHQAQADQLGQALLATLVPARLPEIPGLEAAALYRPANLSQVGGDFYDVFPVGNGDWGVAIGDVGGKGPGAATVAAAARHALRGAAVAHRDAAQVLGSVNEALLMDQEDVSEPIGREDGSEPRLVTAAYVRLHPYREGFRLRVASAGHPVPLVRRRTGRIENLGTGGRLLGYSADPPCSEQLAYLAPGDAVVLFTDGVTEAPVGADLFGVGGIVAVLGASGAGSARGLIDTLDRALRAGTDYQRDDVAVVALKVSGHPARVPPGRGDEEAPAG